MFDSRISAGASENLPGWDKSRAKTSAMMSYDMERHARKCVERYCELANEKTEQLFKVPHPCLNDHPIKMENICELSEVCSHIVLKCLFLARIGRPDILWSVNKLARSVHKMDSSMWQTTGTINFLHSFHDYRYCCHVGNTRLPHASGNRMLQNLKDFNSMPFMSKIESAKFYHPIVKGNLMMTDGESALLCTKKNQRPETERILNVEIATIIDVLGIEVQVPSPSSPGYSVWILISRGHERFVNEIHRHNSDIVNYSFSLAREGMQTQWCVSRIFKTCRG